MIVVTQRTSRGFRPVGLGDLVRLLSADTELTNLQRHQLTTEQQTEFLLLDDLLEILGDDGEDTTVAKTLDKGHDNTHSEALVETSVNLLQLEEDAVDNADKEHVKTLLELDGPFGGIIREDTKP